MTATNQGSPFSMAASSMLARQYFFKSPESNNFQYIYPTFDSATQYYENAYNFGASYSAVYENNYYTMANNNNNNNKYYSDTYQSKEEYARALREYIELKQRNKQLFRDDPYAYPNLLKPNYFDYRNFLLYREGLYDNEHFSRAYTLYQYRGSTYKNNDYQMLNYRNYYIYATIPPLITLQFEPILPLFASVQPYNTLIMQYQRLMSDAGASYQNRFYNTREVYYQTQNTYNYAFNNSNYSQYQRAQAYYYNIAASVTESRPRGSFFRENEDPAQRQEKDYKREEWRRELLYYIEYNQYRKKQEIKERRAQDVVYEEKRRYEWVEYQQTGTVDGQRRYGRRQYQEIAAQQEPGQGVQFVPPVSPLANFDGGYPIDVYRPDEAIAFSDVIAYYIATNYQYQNYGAWRPTGDAFYSIRIENDYLKDLNRYYQEVFTRQVYSLHSDVYKALEKRNGALQDMLVMREKAHHSSVNNALNPNVYNAFEVQRLQRNRYFYSIETPELFEYPNIYSKNGIGYALDADSRFVVAEDVMLPTTDSFQGGVYFVENASALRRQPFSRSQIIEPVNEVENEDSDAEQAKSLQYDEPINEGDSEKERSEYQLQAENAENEKVLDGYESSYQENYQKYSDLDEQVLQQYQQWLAENQYYVMVPEQPPKIVYDSVSHSIESMLGDIDGIIERMGGQKHTAKANAHWQPDPPVGTNAVKNYQSEDPLDGIYRALDTIEAISNYYYQTPENYQQQQPSVEQQFENSFNNIDKLLNYFATPQYLK